MYRKTIRAYLIAEVNLNEQKKVEQERKEINKEREKGGKRERGS